MNEHGFCEKCGAEMRPIDPVKHVGMVCPNCGWGWATTDIDPILDDLQDYSIILEEAANPSAEMVKALSRITGQNYIKARESLKNPPCVIYTGKAKAVQFVARELTSLSIEFSIQPPFPYPTSPKSTFEITASFFDDTHETELSMYVNGENILAFERNGLELTTRWNLDELVEWLRMLFRKTGSYLIDSLKVFKKNEVKKMSN